jgi:hypothetical protein
MSAPQAILICASHSFRDPLFQGLMLQYLRNIQAQSPGQYHFHLITEEQASYALSAEEQAKQQASLAKQGLHWHPIPYRGGSWIVLKKLWNFIYLFLLVFWLHRRHRFQAIIGYMAIAGGYAYLLARLLRLPLGIMGFEPHSLNMLDFGIWTRKSLSYRLLSTLERWQVLGAQALIAPTKHTRQLFRDWGVKGEIPVLGTCIDVHQFAPNAQARARLRKEWGFDENHKILSYIGKFGGIYYEAEPVARFCARLRAAFPQFVVVIISPDNPAEVQAAFERHLPPTALRVLGRVPYEKIQEYFAAADWGLIAVPPLPAQKYRSPVKTGNYLACGLPYFIPKGVSDDDDLAEQAQVGVVLSSLESPDLPLEAIQKRLEEPQATLMERCRQVAIAQRSVERSAEALQAMLRKLAPPLPQPQRGHGQLLVLALAYWVIGLWDLFSSLRYDSEGYPLLHPSLFWLSWSVLLLVAVLPQLYGTKTTKNLTLWLTLLLSSSLGWCLFWIWSLDTTSALRYLGLAGLSLWVWNTHRGSP